MCDGYIIIADATAVVRDYVVSGEDSSEGSALFDGIIKVGKIAGPRAVCRFCYFSTVFFVCFCLFLCCFSSTAVISGSTRHHQTKAKPAHPEGQWSKEPVQVQLPLSINYELRTAGGGVLRNRELVRNTHQLMRKRRRRRLRRFRRFRRLRRWRPSNIFDERQAKSPCVFLLLITFRQASPHITRHITPQTPTRPPALCLCSSLCHFNTHQPASPRSTHRTAATCTPVQLQW